MNNWQNITDTRLVRPRDSGKVIADILDDLNIDNAKFNQLSLVRLKLLG
jgi:antitoxin HigA-1